MLDVISLILFPPKGKAFPLGWASGLLIDYSQIISIWCRFLFGISENHIADGPASAAAEGAALGGDSVGYFRFDDI
jgi:hypothetical protein